MEKLNSKRILQAGLLQAGLAWVIRPTVLAFILIFILAFRARSDQLGQFPSRYLVPNPEWELSAIAIALFDGKGFADPYIIPTGPTAHLPPIYPYIFGLIYHIYGITAKAGLISMQFMVVTGSILCALFPWLSKKFGLGIQAGIIGGLAGAILVEWPGHGEYLTAIAMGLILLAFLKRWRAGKYAWGASVWLGVAIGVAFHLQPALLTVVLGCLIFELWWNRNSKKWGYVGVITLGIFVACLPWGWRNYTTFDSIFFIRSNFGLELRMGNHEGAVATMEVMDALGEHIHPRSHFAESVKLREIGEIAYMQGALEDARTWIKSNPTEFMRLTSLRIVNTWFGPPYNPKAALGISALTLVALIGVWRVFPSLSIPQRAALLIPLLTFPLVYYFVAYMPRYRVPIDWILFILAGSALWQLILRVQSILYSNPKNAL